MSSLVSLPSHTTWYIPSHQSARSPTNIKAQYAVDFYQALCQTTSGQIVPLLNASQLGDYIVGSALETIETEKLIAQYQSTILNGVYGQGKSVDDVMDQVQSELDERKTEMNALNVEDVYVSSAEADANVNAFLQAVNIQSARQFLRPVCRLA